MSHETAVMLECDRVRPAGRGIRLLAWLLASASVAFASVNVTFEVTGRFDSGRLSDYSAGLTVVNWFVTALKLTGAAVALTSISSRPLVPARVVNALLWAAAGVLGLYSLGSVVQAVGLATGLAGSSDQLGAGAVAYVVLFLLAAAGFAALAISHTRRFGVGAEAAVLGVLGGVLLLGVILVALPAVLSAVGLMP